MPWETPGKGAGMRIHIAAGLLATVIGVSFGCNSTPNYSRAKEVGRDYSTTAFDVSVTGTRSLGTNENYRIVGHILPVRKRVTLGESFELSRGDIIALSGTLTEIDKDHLRLTGHFKGLGPAQHPIDTDVDVTILLGIHGGIHYFRDPKNLYAAASGNDYLEINKVEKKDLSDKAMDSDKR